MYSGYSVQRILSPLSLLFLIFLGLNLYENAYEKRVVEMVSGHLLLKQGYWYMVLQVRDETGKTKPKWIATHLKEIGNKKAAEDMLIQARIHYTQQQFFRDRTKGIYFDEFMEDWVRGMENTVAPTTYSSYCNIVRNSICPFFKNHPVALADLRPEDIEEYYDALRSRNVSANTVIHHHANIRKALQQAVRHQKIPCNPADMVERPRKESYISQYYSALEANRLLELIRGDKLEIVVILALCYGLRRSEVLGLRWEAVDFANNTLIINHTITQTTIGGTSKIVARNKVKRQSSFRTFPLLDSVKHLLLAAGYNRYGLISPPEHDYICVDQDGNLFKPETVSKRFSKLLQKHGLRPIRFHDLRHPYVKATTKKYTFYKEILISIAFASSAINLLTSSVSNMDIGC